MLRSRATHRPYYDPSEVTLPSQLPPYDNYERLHDNSRFNNTNYPSKTQQKVVLSQ